MPGKVIGKTMNLGYPGTVSRSPDTMIVSYPCVGADVHFGDPVVLNADNTVSAFGTSGTAATFIGFAVRSVKQAFNYEGDAYYKAGDSVDVLTRGYISVRITNGTPQPRAALGILEGNMIGTGVTPGGGKTIISLTNAVFTSGRVDANGVTEVSVLSRVV
jgi:hypothetical protein